MPRGKRRGSAPLNLTGARVLAAESMFGDGGGLGGRHGSMGTMFGLGGGGGGGAGGGGSGGGMAGTRSVEAVVARLAYLGQDLSHCNPTSTDADALDNCAQLNAASAHFDGGVHRMRKPGVFEIMSTRNNAFSNRGHKGAIVVEHDHSQLHFYAALAGAALLLLAASGAHRRCRSLLRRCCCCCCHKGKQQQQQQVLAASSAAAPPPRKPRSRSALAKCVPRRVREWWGYESQKVKCLLGFVAANAAIGAAAYAEYRGQGLPYFALAKTGGAMLNFCCSFILLPVLRNLISLLRSTPLASVLPLDDNVGAHKVVFWLGVCGAGALHVVCHYLDFLVLRERHGVAVVESALLNRTGATGHLVLLGMVAMAATASDRVRRRRFVLFGGRLTIGGYSLFVAVHRCWKWVFAALLLHAPRFWIWSFWPLLFMLLESVFRRWRGAFEVQVLEARLFEGDVMQLRMKLGGTRKFVFRAGQYLFLSCPAVSAEEWHPFTITSAPEESTFTCHIRCRKGMDWTYALRMLLNPAGAPRVLFSDQVARGAAEEGGGGSGAGGAGGAAGGAAGAAAAAAAAAPLIVKENPLRRHMSLDDNSPEPGGGGGGGGGGGAAAGAARETAAATRRLSMESVSAAALMPSYPVVRPLAARDD